MKKLYRRCLLMLFMVCCISMAACQPLEELGLTGSSSNQGSSLSVSEVPEYSGEPYVVINENQPDFSEEDMTKDSFETYSDLDSLGRCQSAYANVGQDLMPTGERGNISKIKPSGWQTAKYDIVDGKYLYNRCHLI